MSENKNSFVYGAAAGLLLASLVSGLVFLLSGCATLQDEAQLPVAIASKTMPCDHIKAHQDVSVLHLANGQSFLVLPENNNKPLRFVELKPEQRTTIVIRNCVFKIDTEGNVRIRE